jgi:hypothetical protein|tara:strand:- start:8 stop:211 length:204 start_codon:yes stop_codon:yes gene_type:complete
MIMELCDKCGIKVYERNLDLIDDKFVCPSCVGDAQEKAVESAKEALLAKLYGNGVSKEWAKTHLIIN